MRMKKLGFGILFVSIAMTTQASEFEGGYVGASVGSNKSSASALPNTKSTYLSLKTGYNWDWDRFVLGGEGYFEEHKDSYTGQDAGLDARLGLPMDRWMPYAKLGLAVTSPGARLHGGLGMEYSLTERLKVNAEWTRDKKNDNGISKKNNNIAVGLNWFFGGSAAKVASVVVVATPVADNLVAEKPVEKVAQPQYKILVNEKLVTLEGTNFATSSAKLNPSVGEQLDKVVEFAAVRQDANLQITGHTDSRGNEERNVKLSLARAESVKAYLVGKGVAAERLITSGVGSDQPVADNGTVAGRAMNRRVEITSVVTEERKVLVK